MGRLLTIPLLDAEFQALSEITVQHNGITINFLNFASAVLQVEFIINATEALLERTRPGTPGIIKQGPAAVIKLPAQPYLTLFNLLKFYKSSPKHVDILEKLLGLSEWVGVVFILAGTRITAPNTITKGISFNANLYQGVPNDRYIVIAGPENPHTFTLKDALRVLQIIGEGVTDANGNATIACTISSSTIVTEAYLQNIPDPLIKFTLSGTIAEKPILGYEPIVRVGVS